MLFATVPQRYARYLIRETLDNELCPDGQARYVPNGLRVVEALLLQDFSPEEIAVTYPGQLDRFVGERTRAVGIHVHNPLGITFATDIYGQLAGPESECVNAAEFRRIVEHPALARERHHLKVIAGGPGAWQISHAARQDAFGIDCLVDGEAESLVLPLFHRAVEGADLPRTVKGSSPQSPAEIPITRGRSTLGAVEITRGCGRGCQFCGIALRHGQSVPLDRILANVRANVAGGADNIMLVTEDLFLYEQGPAFRTNADALARLFQSVVSVPGVRHLSMSHATMAPIVADPSLIERLTEIGVGRSHRRHPRSTHPDRRYQTLFIGLETGSVRLFREYMKGKSYPFRPEQWPGVVLKGIEILNRHNWYPFCTVIVGLPGETDADVTETLDLLHGLKGARLCLVPTLFVPLEDTRLSGRRGAQLPRLTERQWEVFFTCWRYSLDFFRPGRTGIFRVGAPLYYYLRGRHLFGSAMKYPLLRLGHLPERLLSRRLYLDLRRPPSLQVPDAVPVPPHNLVSIE